MEANSLNLPQVLICDNDQSIHVLIKNALKKQAHFKSAYSGAEAVALVKKNNFNLLLLDIDLGEEKSGLDWVEEFTSIDPNLNLIVMSSFTEFTLLRRSIQLGAIDFIPKKSPLSQDQTPSTGDSNFLIDLELALERTTKQSQLLEQNKQSQFELKKDHQKHPMIGNSPEILKLRDKITKLKTSKANIMIYGATGAGKEVVARQLRHTLADGNLAPFVAVDSATIQSSTAESLLFGHEKGAFTGADKTTRGYFEEANGGIIYFDEIANMSLEIQSKLLRVIQEKEIMRVGSTKSIQLDFKVVCATNRDLYEMVKQGLFKDDLLQRLAVIPVHLPTLKERKSDIPLLLEHYLKVHQSPMQNLSISETALSALTEYEWPGNIRELNNTIAYITTLIDDSIIEISDLPPRIQESYRKNSALSSFNHLENENIPPTSANDFELNSSLTPAMLQSFPKQFYPAIQLFEQYFLKEAFNKHGKNISKLAQEIGMDRSYLYAKLKEYKIHEPTPKIKS